MTQVDTDFSSQRELAIEEIRKENSAYEYLCHLEEARIWMQECLRENFPLAQEFEARMRNGVYFAKLGNYIAPHVVPIKKIYDHEQRIYDSSGLNYRHIDNINYWTLAMNVIGLPELFYPDAFDVYGKKNMPKAVYCIHALSLYLYRCGEGIKILDLMGKIHFSKEEIDAVKLEFAKSRIQLPAFSKIGSLLNGAIAPTNVNIYAAVIAINIAISQKNSENLCSALLNPNAALKNVSAEYAGSYLIHLSELKFKKSSQMKIEANSKNIPYISADFLTSNVIQCGIDAINFEETSKLLNSSQNIKDFMNMLRHPYLNLADIFPDCADMYLEEYAKYLRKCDSKIVSQPDLQAIITSVNNCKKMRKHETSVLHKLNKILDSDNYLDCFGILKSNVFNERVHECGAEFYHKHLTKLKKEKGSLNAIDIQCALRKLAAILDINVAIFEGEDSFFNAISNPVVKTWILNPNYKQLYVHATLNMIHNEKPHEKYLSLEQIKSCIDAVNKMEWNLVNFSDRGFDCKSSLKLDFSVMQLSLQNTNLTCINPKNENLYFHLILMYLENNQVTLFSLSDEEIQAQIDAANKMIDEAEKEAKLIVSIHNALEKRDSDMLWDKLYSFSDLHQHICQNCRYMYLKLLLEENENRGLKFECRNDISFFWVRYEASPTVTFFLHLNDLKITFSCEEHLVFLSKREILKCVLKVKSCYKCFSCHSVALVSFQSRIRGFLTRCALKGITNSDSNAKNAAVKIQSFLRMSVIRLKYLQQKCEKQKVLKAVKLIQHCWREFKMHQNFKILTHSSNPPLSLIQKIICMLEISNDDYSDELRLHNIQSNIILAIHYNQDLLKEVDEMDIKIGLLIQNRITIEELMSQKKTLNLKHRKEFKEDPNRKLSISTKYKDFIEAFENLLYLLQTKSHYLAKLITLPMNQANSLIESVVLSLYNYGSTPREEYFLLKLLHKALEQEITFKIDELSDMIKSDHLVVKILFSLYRKIYQPENFRKLLQPLIKSVLQDTYLLYGPNPIDIYKVWQNDIEIETGKKSNFPYHVTVEEALYHEEVNHRFNMFLDNLLKHSLHFCEVIINTPNILPYGIMYMGKVMKRTLKKKFSFASCQELSKIIGNFLYYRFINPMIVAPDRFGILDSVSRENLNDIDRIKLSFVSNFLQFAAVGKDYSVDNSHLMCLNPYLKDCHEKFLLFFDDVCNVCNLEEHFNVCHFTDALITAPEVHLKLQELICFYEILLENEYVLAPDSADILHEVLEEFDAELLNDVLKNEGENVLSTQLSLSLSCKSKFQDNIVSDEDKIYLEAKFMLITLMQIFPSQECISEFLNFQQSDDIITKFEMFNFVKKNGPICFTNDSQKSQNWKTLASFQKALQHNLNILELAGFVSIKNNYQDILNDIIKDILNRWKYRTCRKEEIEKLLEIEKKLESKTRYYLEKLDCYHKYVFVCLENFKLKEKHTPRKFSRIFTTDSYLKKEVLIYSGYKLHKKGILLEIHGLGKCQLKNVLFEISLSEDLGIFIVKVNFMGLHLDTMHVNIQDLIWYKYQGIAVINLFGSAKINNNFFLHLLNKKFYGK